MRSLLLVLVLVSLVACEDALPTAPRPFAAKPSGIVIRGPSGDARRVDISPLDIESVEVIKAATAATIYGKQCDMVIRIDTRNRTKVAWPDTAGTRTMSRFAAPGGISR